jgi:hypothetical protein
MFSGSSVVSGRKGRVGTGVGVGVEDEDWIAHVHALQYLCATINAPLYPQRSEAVMKLMERLGPRRRAHCGSVDPFPDNGLRKLYVGSVVGRWRVFLGESACRSVLVGRVQLCLGMGVAECGSLWVWRCGGNSAGCGLSVRQGYRKVLGVMVSVNLALRPI